MMNELDVNCYVRILEYIETQLSNGRDLMASISKLLIKLVRKLECGTNQESINNGIELATSFIRHPSAHHYNTIGTKSKDLDVNDKEQMLSFLREEVLPN